VTAQLHAAAILDRLRTSPTAVTVHDGKVPDTTPLPVPPYVVMHFSGHYAGAAEDPAASDLVFRSLKFVATVTLHSVATTANGARVVAGRVSSALKDHTLTVAGRECSPLRHTDDYMAQPDEETGTDYFTLVDVYRMSSQPS
jgi:hypothetical protein